MGFRYRRAYILTASTPAKLTHYAHNPSIPNTLSNNNVNNIMQDSNGNLWFSTSGSGLDRYRKESNDFENFDMQKDGLSSDCIYEVFESSIQKERLAADYQSGDSPSLTIRKRSFTTTVQRTDSR